jgi:pimeloyl-ACP methyl ester carboxylesterase
VKDIFIEDNGKGHAFVFVHGFLGSSEMWSLQKDYFKSKFRIISPALPGFGESHKSPSLDSINDMAKFVLEIIEEKKINKFHLIGHSMGGMIVQEMAKIAGDKIEKLICFATSSIGEIPGRFETMDESISRLKEEGISELKTRIPPKWFVKGNKDKNYFFCENAVTNISEETASNALHAMKQWNGFENLKNIKNETLIIWGDKDISYNFDQVDALNKNIKNSRLEIFKGCCHNVHLEQPDKFNILIKNFLD